MCRSKNQAQICSVYAKAKDENDKEEESETFLGAIRLKVTSTKGKVTSTKGKEKSWTATVTINSSREIEFKVDTGADVTVILPSAYNAEEDGKLSAPTRTLTGPGQQTLEVMGQFTARRAKRPHRRSSWLEVSRKLF